MASSAAAWLVLWVAFVAANLPFLSQRILIIGPRRADKPLGWRAIELLLMWAVTLAVGFALEARLGQVQGQHWEFFAAFGFLFLTFAFPGFVWRCLRAGRSNGSTPARRSMPPSSPSSPPSSPPPPVRPAAGDGLTGGAG